MIKLKHVDGNYSDYNNRVKEIDQLKLRAKWFIAAVVVFCVCSLAIILM